MEYKSDIEIAQECNLLGRWVEEGEYPADFDALGRIVKGISYRNAKNYFNF